MMKQTELDEVIACLGNERNIFYYFKDRYCLELLKWHIEATPQKSLTVQDLKNNQLKYLANKPIIKEILKHCGNRYLTIDNSMNYWPEQHLNFVLSLARWGDGDRGWDQTTRNQKNLVLQINFDNKHSCEYQRLLKPDIEYGPFEFHCHPIRKDYRNTMAWVRIDFDLKTNEALIEEVQNDWLRFANNSLCQVRRQRASKHNIKPSEVIDGINCDYKNLEYYIETVLKPYNQLWAEASLLAAIDFIRNELGIKTIYYHSFETGNDIKKVHGKPPLSMYTQLPKKFGFKLTDETPCFIKNHRYCQRYLKKIKAPKWYQLTV